MCGRGAASHLVMALEAVAVYGHFAKAVNHVGIDHCGSGGDGGGWVGRAFPRFIRPLELQLKREVNTNL